MSTVKFDVADGEGSKFANWIKMQLLLSQANNLLRSRFIDRWRKHSSQDWEADRKGNAQDFITGCGQKLYDKLGKIQKDWLQSGNLNEWDVTLFTDVFMVVSFKGCGGGADKEEKRQMEQLKQARNRVAHKQGGLSDQDFEELWNKAQPVVSYLGGGADEIDKIKNSANVSHFENQDQSLGQVNTGTTKEAERCKKEGNDLFRDQKFEAAIEIYTTAIALDGLSQVDRGILYSNRSASYLGLVEQRNNEKVPTSSKLSTEYAKERALDDAKEVMRIRPAWYKGYFRAGKAYLSSRKYEKAVRAFDWALSLAPGNKEIQHARDDGRRRLGIDTRNEHMDPTQMHLLNRTEEETRRVLEEKVGLPITKEMRMEVRKMTEIRIRGQADVYKAHEFRDGSNGVTQNEEKAVKYYTKAASVGNAEAMYNLGNLYQTGRGVKQGFCMSVKLLKEAAALPPFRKGIGGMKEPVVGVAEAQHALGLAYQEGVGVEQDDKVARKWYEKAVENDFAASANNLGFIYQDGLGVEPDMKRAGQYWHLSASLGNPLAMESLAYYYAYFEHNAAQAERWFNLAMANGNLHAKLNKKGFDSGIAKLKKDTDRSEKVLNAWEAENGQQADGLSKDARFHRMGNEVCPGFETIVDDLATLTMKGNAKSKTPLSKTKQIYERETLQAHALRGSKTAQGFLKARIHFEEAMKLFALSGLKGDTWPKFCHELAECCRHESLVIQCPKEMRRKMAELVYEYLKCFPADGLPCDRDREARICYSFLNMFNMEQSLRFEQASLKKYPDECLFYHMCSNWHGFLKQYKEALELAQRGLKLFPGDLELTYNVAAVGYLMTREEVPTDSAIRAYEEFLALAPRDHRKVPLAYYGIAVLVYTREMEKPVKSKRKTKPQLNLTEVNKYYRLGLEAEKEQLPYFLPYECSQKSVLENFLRLAALIPGVKPEIVPERGSDVTEPLPSELSFAGDVDVTALTSPMRAKVIREHREFVRDYLRKVAQLEQKEGRFQFTTTTPKHKQGAPQKLAGLKSILFRDMDMFKDHVYENCVLAVRSAENPANVPSSPSILLVLEDEHHHVCRAFVYNFAGGTPKDYNFNHVLTQLGHGAKLSIINPYMRLATDGGYGIRVDDPSTLFLHSPSEPKSCRFCGRKDAKQRCGKCGSAWYCGRECQEIDWKKLHHKYICSAAKPKA